MAEKRVTVQVNVDPNADTTIKAFGEALAENVHPSAVADTTVSATGTGTNPPDADGDGDID